MNGRPLVEKKTERESTTLRLARDHETAPRVSLGRWMVTVVVFNSLKTGVAVLEKDTATV
jgi:hypothetical protein